MDKGHVRFRSIPGLIFFQWRHFWPYYVFGLLALVLTHYAGSLIPFLASDLIDSFSHPEETKIQFYHFIVPIFGAIVFRTLSRILFFHPARLLQGKLMIFLVRLMEKHFYGRFSHYDSGQILQTLNSDTRQIRAFSGFAFLQVFNFLIALFIFMPKIFAFNSTLVWAFTPLVGSVFVVSFVITKNGILYEAMEKERDYMQNALIESYRGLDTIQNFGQDSSFVSIFSDSVERECEVSLKAANRISYVRPLVGLGLGLSLAIGALVIKVSSLGVSTFALFSTFLFLLFEPMMFLSWIGIIVSHTRVCLKRVDDLYVTVMTKSALEKEFESNDFNLSNLAVPLWNRVSHLDLSGLSRYVIVGKTGGGKSELLKRLALLFKTHHHSISYVHQNPYLFNDTIKVNIFLKESISLSEKESALHLLKLFELDSLAPSSEELLDLKVGEFGKRLSGGQIKRLAIVRSLLSSAQTYMWDDPFSSIDLVMESRIMKELSPFFKDKRVIFTIHRLSTALSF